LKILDRLIEEGLRLEDWEGVLVWFSDLRLERWRRKISQHQTLDSVEPLRHLSRAPFLLLICDF